MEQVKDAIERWNSVENLKRELVIRETQLGANAIALQQAGIIPLMTDPDSIIAALSSIPDEASLRSKALMKGENPRN